MNRNDIAETIESVIADHGWAIQSASTERCTPFSYTVGLDRFHHPEVMIAGRFSPEIMHDILNDIGDEISAGNRFDDWSYSDCLLHGRRVWFREMSEEGVSTLAKAAILRNQAARVLQAIIPDKTGLFPWDAACEPRFSAQLHGQSYYRLQSLN